jgi:hypothetical protein
MHAWNTAPPGAYGFRCTRSRSDDHMAPMGSPYPTGTFTIGPRVRPVLVPTQHRHIMGGYTVIDHTNQCEVLTHGACTCGARARAAMARHDRMMGEPIHANITADRLGIADDINVRSIDALHGNGPSNGTHNTSDS